MYTCFLNQINADESIEVIDLSTCNLKEVPEDIYQHKESVKKLLLETNSLKIVPQVCYIYITNYILLALVVTIFTAVSHLTRFISMYLNCIGIKCLVFKKHCLVLTKIALKQIKNFMIKFVIKKLAMIFFVKYVCTRNFYQLNV